MMKRSWLALALTLALPATAGTAQTTDNGPPHPDAGDVAAGYALAENLCSVCHALEAGAPSPNPDAPNFNALVLTYPPEFLAEGFAEGIVVGSDAHIGMPEFALQPDQIDDLISYLEVVLPPAQPLDAEAEPAGGN